MGKYTQAGRIMSVATPLATDALLLEKFAGAEAISELFSYELDMLAEQAVPFNKIMGQSVTVTIAPRVGPPRYFNGIVKDFSEGHPVNSSQGKATLIRYHAQVVPRFWLLTRRAQTRTWQHLSVPDILSQLFQDPWQMDFSLRCQETYLPRNYCTQYRETDFAFACRLMEEEGMVYYFQHSAGKHQMIVSDICNASAYASVPGVATLDFDLVEGGSREAPRVWSWVKKQSLCSGKYSLRDHSFELPGQSLAAEQSLLESVTAGQISHTLKVSGSDAWEIYDYPGFYSHRYDGINKAGGEQPSQLSNIFTDNLQRAKILARQEAAQGLAIEGASDCSGFVPGTLFTLERHLNGNGKYLLTHVKHSASLEGAYMTGSEESKQTYDNRFTCVPDGLPYLTPSVTPRPKVQGSQTATVVGPAGSQIFTDKYGRVKVQFPWDRLGKSDVDSSCWLRVAQDWAGKGFGALHLPRVGQEVLVDFLEGDPDRPIVVGCVYNAEQMPPFSLPANANLNCIKSSTVNGGTSNYSGLAMSDEPGAEHIQMHGEKDMTISTENNKYVSVGADQKVVVVGSHTESVGANQQISVSGNHSQAVGSNHLLSVGGTHTHTVSGDYLVTLGGPGGGSGGGGGAPWEVNAQAAPPATLGYSGNYVLMVWGSNSSIVMGNSDGLVAGSVSYVTLGLFNNLVVGANTSVILGANTNVSIGVNTAITLAAQIGFTAGSSYQLTAEGLVNVAALPIEHVSPVSVSLITAPSSLIVLPEALIMGTPPSFVTISEAAISIDVGPTNVTLTPVSITLTCGPCVIAMTEDAILFSFAGVNSIEIGPSGISKVVIANEEAVVTHDRESATRSDASGDVNIE